MRTRRPSCRGPHQLGPSFVYHSFFSNPNPSSDKEKLEITPKSQTVNDASLNVIFNCSASTLESLKWPNNRVASKHMPKRFSQHFKRCTCVIEGTEIFIAMLANTTNNLTVTQLSTLTGHSGCFFSASKIVPHVSL